MSNEGNCDDILKHMGLHSGESQSLSVQAPLETLPLPSLHNLFSRQFLLFPVEEPLQQGLTSASGSQGKWSEEGSPLG